MNRADLRRLREERTKLREGADMSEACGREKNPPPDWFCEWVMALAAEMYAAAGISRDAARLHSFQSGIKDLHSVFTKAHWYFVRHLGCEPTQEEWLDWLARAEEAAPLPEGESDDRERAWLLVHGRMWRQQEVNTCVP
jgi:hypothetical protein